MTTTAPTNPYPNIVPPAGAEADIWQGDASETYRVCFGTNRGLAGRDDVLVSASVVQLGDGTLDDGRVTEPPFVWVETNHDRGLTSAEARDLAAEIIAAADEIDGWVAR